MCTNLITISGPRGASKDTVISEVLKEFGSRLHRIIPCTTRAPRVGEIHGVHQYFISEKEFEENDKLKKFVFANPPHGGYRSGTLKTELGSHGLSIIDITAKGAGELRDYVYSHQGRAISLFIYADYETRFTRISIRQVDLISSEIEKMMKIDEPTDPNPDAHPDWFIKISNPDGCLIETVKQVENNIVDFLRN